MLYAYKGLGLCFRTSKLINKRTAPATIKIECIPITVAMAAPANGPMKEPVCWAEKRRPKTRPFTLFVVAFARIALIDGLMPEKKRPTPNWQTAKIVSVFGSD